MPIKLLKPLRYFFYRAASWKLRDPAESTPLFTAALLTAMLLVGNAFALLLLLSAISGRDLDPFRPLLGHRLKGIAVFAGLMLPLIFAFLRAWAPRGDIRELTAEFASPNDRTQRFRTIAFWGYIAVSILLPPLVGLAIWLSRN